MRIVKAKISPIDIALVTEMKHNHAGEFFKQKINFPFMSFCVFATYTWLWSKLCKSNRGFPDNTRYTLLARNLMVRFGWPDP